MHPTRRHLDTFGARSKKVVLKAVTVTVAINVFAVWDLIHAGPFLMFDFPSLFGMITSQFGGMHSRTQI